MKESKIVKTKKGYVFIDTCSLDNLLGNMMDRFGMGNNDAVGKRFETMVFACDKNGNVKDWKDLDKNNYYTEKEAVAGHKKLVMKWKSK